MWIKCVWSCWILNLVLAYETDSSSSSEKIHWILFSLHWFFPFSDISAAVFSYCLFFRFLAKIQLSLASTKRIAYVWIQKCRMLWQIKHIRYISTWRFQCQCWCSLKVNYIHLIWIWNDFRPRQQENAQWHHGFNWIAV